MNTIFSIVSKVSFGLLLAGTIVSCNQGAKTQNEPSKNDSNAVSKESQGSNKDKIVYLNSDSLSEKYQYFKDIKSKLENKVKKAQADLQAKSAAFQREVADYQKNAATMSAADRQATEQKLARKQDELARLDQTASSSLAKDESEEFNNVYNKITEFLKKHAADNGYKLVLTYSKSNPTVLYADPSLEITNEVIKQLNDEYKSSNK
ncbi:OmpH family outer membrane protein [Sphingobacterium detergens]|uniref:Periplasmic chaperone for outer membrane proteins Skp n=1 Tax=Sphingobacterium detergens TaxID=1145106 RepID=A0A420B7E0_SPHD1|nr:OmpH family outer membrane protein [Sphingobacterium detergens]RKE52568.1 periplasmic chaperone for outer membrane proteins Skp [Sphingobacterium detergens]